MDNLEKLDESHAEVEMLRTVLAHVLDYLQHPGKYGAPVLIAEIVTVLEWTKQKESEA